ncbi:MAG: UDP-N-acetylmuramate--L-alanine ligase [bacterium]
MKIYFNGIGGAGLAPLSLLAKKFGHEVSGSDITDKGNNVDYLRQNGINVSVPGNPDNITNDIDLIIYTAASAPGTLNYNEIEKAKGLNIRCERRGFLIDLLIKNLISIGVCGTHGKTTTTSLLTHCLIEIGEDPTYSVGGIMESTGKSSDVGSGKYFTWEADEYANQFHEVHISYAIVNNIEYDHPDFFKTEEDYINSFKFFIENNVSEKIIVNTESSNVQKAIINIDKDKIITFGSSISNDFYFSDILVNSSEMDFIIHNKNLEYKISSHLHGRHNTSNITAVFALLMSLGFDSDKVISAIKTFIGSGRRFETIFENENVKVISDYAHHPTAIKTTILAAKELGMPVTAVFEPHQYSRIKILLNQFHEAFIDAEKVIILPIYASRDPDTTIVTSEDLYNEIDNNNKYFYKSYKDILTDISSAHINKTVYLCMSAGTLDDFLRKNLV